MTASAFDVTPGGWLPHRGDYGTGYADQLVGMVEQTTCVQGCARSGTDLDRVRYGPGGTCLILANLGMGKRMPQIEPTGQGPVCTARQPWPAVEAAT